MIDKVFSFFGKAFCHTIAERSLVADGITFSVCARCSGIYISAAIVFIYFLIRKRLKGNKPPSILSTVLLAIMLLPFMLDGLTSYMGLRESNNLLRFVTGILGGLPLPVFLTLITNFDPKGENTKPIIKNVFELIFILCFVSFLGYLCYNNLLGYFIPQVLILLGILSIYISLLYMVYSIVLKKKKIAIKLSFITFFVYCIIVNFLRIMMR